MFEQEPHNKNQDEHTESQPEVDPITYETLTANRVLKNVQDFLKKTPDQLDEIADSHKFTAETNRQTWEKMLGLKESNDIDIVVSPEIFERAKSDGWESVPYAYPDKLGKFYLKKGDIELYLDVNHGEIFRPSLKELLQRAEIFDGIPFLSLQDLLKFKESYNRPKDHKDIELIKGYFTEILKSEGLSHVYEWTDKPGTEYKSHKHKGKVGFYVIQGSIDMTIGNKSHHLTIGDRIDVPVGVEHKATVGSEGATYIVGEEVEGDS